MWTPRSLEALSRTVLIALIALPTVAADSAATERDRIARERAQAEAKARAGEAACAKEFAVAACTKSVRAERRSVMQQLDGQRALLDDAQRKQRAAERLARIRERQDAEASAAEKPSVEIKTRQAGPSTPRGRSDEDTRAEALSREQRSAAAATAVQREDVQAARRAAAARQREQDAARHRAQAEQRNRERAAQKPPAAGLPVPPASTPSR
jgi:colicin import membrane protein